MTKLRGRLEGDHIVEFDFPANILDLPGIKWIDVPDYFTEAGNLLALKVVDDKVVPVDETAYKAQIKAKVSAKRKLARENGGVFFNGNVFHTDIESIGALTSAVGLAQIFEAQNGEGTFTTAWKSKTGFVILKYADLIQLAFLTGKFTTDVFAKEEEYGAEIDAEPDFSKCIEIADNSFNYLYELPDDIAVGNEETQAAQTTEQPQTFKTSRKTTATSKTTKTT